MSTRVLVGSGLILSILVLIVSYNLKGGILFLTIFHLPGQEGEPSLLITSTGEETREFTYVGELVDRLLRVGYFELAIGELFNLVLFVKK